MQNVNDRPRPLLLRRPEAQRLLGLGPTRYKELLAQGHLREIGIGKRGRRLPLSEAERFVASRLAGEAAE